MIIKHCVFFRRLRWIFQFLKFSSLALVTSLLCNLSPPVLANLTYPNLKHPQTQIQHLVTHTQSLVEQGKAFYEAGQFAEALKVLEQAAIDFKNTGDQLNQAMVLSNLSLTYQQLGQVTEGEKAITQSLNLLQSLNTSKDYFAIIGQALDVQGKLQLMQGQTEAALSTWQKAAEIYQQIGDKETLISNRINSAQAMQALGLYHQAQKTLTEVEQTLTSLTKLPIKAAGLLSLGNVLRSVGDLDKSRTILEQSLVVAKQVQSSKAIADTLLSLGNTAFTQGKSQLTIGNTEFAQQQIQAALRFYQQTATIAPPTTRLQAQLNQLSLILEILNNKSDENTLKKALGLSSQIRSEINKSLPSRNSVYARIQFASILKKLRHQTTINGLSNLDIAQLLSTAVQQAQNLRDQRAESYALGFLGGLYENNKQLSDALALTEKALFIAQSINASDIIYQWQWQQGRLLKQQGDIKDAIVAYDAAYKTLESLRGDLVTASQDVQFSFRENVEPVYRELVELQLRTENLEQGTPESSQYKLKQARQVVESLQLAELNNFFRSACLEPIVEIDKVVTQDKKAAIIYPIILPNSLELILTLPNQQLRHYTSNISQEKVQSTIALLHEYLPDVAATSEVKQQSQKIYDWLIKPAQAELSNNGITTLVFVLDGELRNIPMGVLYDQQNKKYLIEKYAIALTAGLQLLDPKPLQKVQLNALIAGVGEARSIEGRKFSSLKNVAGELKEIQMEIPNSQEFLNQNFIDNNLRKKLQTSAFSVVHLATHGEFSSDPERTFLLTWDKLLKVKQFDTLLRVSDKRSRNIELLVLSACKTALGDQRAALGLAGIAVRAGARSTLASLWSVDDQSTAQLMSEFYRELKTGISKAQALQRAQLAVFAKEKSPYFWAPYVLVGNWL
ncbi:MAG: CHAT domain-containing protein [Nostoc sp.]|uniref:CHAT domain-containing protein n=1 Tax=Nostoc sp. TaxID=1180 RepID=UPI002FF10647